MKHLFSEHIDLVGRVMDLRLTRQNLVMSNLANINTPHYRPVRIEFEDELQDALALDAKGKMSRTQAGHIPSEFNPSDVSGESSRSFSPQVVMGDDSVDLDKEVAAMTKNTMMYNALTTVLKHNFEGLKKIIQEGGR
ncbi:MAG: flagellar basal body rod protein FlgB [Desulfovibrio sp.]|nr:MAG: flagellar basal body rod protein FlgB [Desulfovibrio sp.]